MLKTITATAVVSIVGALSISTAAFGGPLGYAAPEPAHSAFEHILRDRGAIGNDRERADVPAHLRRQLVA